jgi:hypothetical protein
MASTGRIRAVGVRAGGRVKRGRAFAIAAVPLALMSGLCAVPASAHHAPVGKATFPGSNIRCSSGQKTYLKAAWQEAYAYTKRAESLIDHIARQPTDDERRRLWEPHAGVGREPHPDRHRGGRDGADGVLTGTRASPSRRARATSTKDASRCRRTAASPAAPATRCGVASLVVDECRRPVVVCLRQLLRP